MYRQNPQNVFFQASCKKFAKSITSVCIFVKARNGIWNTKSGKKTGRYCNKFQFQFQFSKHINQSIHKETQTRKKKTKNKKYQTDNATYNSLVSIYNTFYFPLCCHVDTCFFLKIYIYFFRIFVFYSYYCDSFLYLFP